MLQHIIKGTAAASFGRCADLLARAVAAAPQDGLTILRSAVATLVAALPGDPARDMPRDPWVRAPRMNARAVVDFMNAAAPIDAALAGRAADHMLAWPKMYGLDSVLVPAVRDLVGSAAAKNSAGVERLRAACLDHLHGRIAEPLAPPADWRRTSKLASHLRPRMGTARCSPGLVRHGLPSRRIGLHGSGLHGSFQTPFLAAL